jgi:multidrug resistance protein, MATE family
MTMTIELDSRAAQRAWPGLAAAAPILRLAAPLTGFFAIQSATSLASVAILGRLGDSALAGVGAAGAVYGVVLALMFGVDAAVQSLASRRAGAGRGDLAGAILADALGLSLPLGAALAGALWFAAPALLGAMLPHARAAAGGAGYLRAAAPSILFLAFTIPVNAGWIGSGRPALAFLVTALLAPVQVGATLLLVFGAGPLGGLGPAGAGAAISLACAAGAVVQLVLALRQGAVPGFLRTAPRGRGLSAIAAIGWPISLQQAALQLGLIVAYLIVARLGVASVAATNVLISLATVPAQLAVGLGVAAATLVGQSLGRGEPATARQWGWRTMGLGLALSAPFALAAVAAPRALLGLFLHDPATLALAVWPLRLIGLGLAGDMAARVLCFAIRGAGATRIGAGVPFASQWLVQLPLSWWIAVTLGFGLLGLTAVQAGVGLAEAAATALIWAGSRWTVHRILSRAP